MHTVFVYHDCLWANKAVYSCYTSNDASIIDLSVVCILKFFQFTFHVTFFSSTLVYILTVHKIEMIHSSYVFKHMLSYWYKLTNTSTRSKYYDHLPFPSNTCFVNDWMLTGWGVQVVLARSTWICEDGRTVWGHNCTIWSCWRRWFYRGEQKAFFLWGNLLRRIYSFLIEITVVLRCFLEIVLSNMSSIDSNAVLMWSFLLLIYCNDQINP